MVRIKLVVVWFPRYREHLEAAIPHRTWQSEMYICSKVTVWVQQSLTFTVSFYFIDGWPPVNNDQFPEWNFNLVFPYYMFIRPFVWTATNHLVLRYRGVCLPIMASRDQWTWIPNSLLMRVNSVDYEPQGTEVIQSTFYLATPE